MGTIVVEFIVVAIAIYASAYFKSRNIVIDPPAVILEAAKQMLPPWIGILLLAAAVVVVISTGMNYLLSPSTNLIRDIYQTFINPKADQNKMVALQKIMIFCLGIVAFLMIFIPTVFHLQISVLKYAYFAYTIYGVAITPALIAALAWRRATKAGGVSSILSGALMVIFLDIVVPYLIPSLMVKGDPFGIPSIYPSAIVSIGVLVIVSYLTPKPDAETLAKLFPEEAVTVKS